MQLPAEQLLSVTIPSNINCLAVQAIVALIASAGNTSQQQLMNRINFWYDELARFSVPPFAPLPYAFKGGLLGAGDTVGSGKLQGAEMKRAQAVLTYVVDALPGATDTVVALTLAR